MLSRSGALRSGVEGELASGEASELAAGEKLETPARKSILSELVPGESAGDNGGG